MTTLVVVKKQGVVAIAADTTSTQGSCVLPARYKSHPTKVIRIGKSFVASAGSAANIRVLRNLVSRHKGVFRLDSADEVFETFRVLHPLLVEEYHLMTKEDDDSQPYESSQLNLLIANASGIYEVASYREVMEYEKFWATGSGYRFAIGALEALYGNRTLSARALARRACEVACTFDDGSGAPVEVHTVRLKR